MATIKKMMKSSGSFPDLNKDGKITKADILKGRGVIAKHGVGMHKMPDGKMMKNSKMGMGGKSPMMKMQYGGKAASMVPKGAKKANYGASMMSKGGKMKMGGKLKPVDKTKKPGLAKLPKAVRNKMGFKKNGGAMSKKK